MNRSRDCTQAKARLALEPAGGYSAYALVAVGGETAGVLHPFCPLATTRPTVTSNEAGRRFFLHVCSCKRVGLRREKSLFSFFPLVTRSSSLPLPPKKRIVIPTVAEGPLLAVPHFKIPLPRPPNPPTLGLPNQNRRTRHTHHLVQTQRPRPPLRRRHCACLLASRSAAHAGGWQRSYSEGAFDKNESVVKRHFFSG